MSEEKRKPAVLWLQKTTIIIIIVMLVVVYGIQIYQYIETRVVKARLEERESIINVISKKSDSLKEVIILNQKTILHNQDSIIHLFKIKK